MAPGAAGAPELEARRQKTENRGALPHTPLGLRTPDPSKSSAAIRACANSRYLLFFQNRVQGTLFPAGERERQSLSQLTPQLLLGLHG
jgi:hypothetical protein